MKSRSRTQVLRQAAVPAFLFLCIAPAAAQCTNPVLTGFGPGSVPTGINNNVHAIASRTSSEVVIGGDFTTVGGVPCDRIALWDGQSWSPMGGGVNGPVFGLAKVPDAALFFSDRIVACGSFTTAGSVGAAKIAMWDGGSWSPLGAGLTGPGAVSASTVVALANGHVIVGGTFTAAGTTSVSNIAEWDGFGWQSLGAGVNGGVSDLAVMPNGDVVAGGSFTSAGGVSASRIARWNGSTWAPLGGGITTAFGSVYAVAVHSDGSIFAAEAWATGGFFTFSTRVVRWNGATWSQVGTSLPGIIYALHVLPDGDVLVGGGLGNTLGPVTQDLLRWDGSSWVSMEASYGWPGSNTVRVIERLALQPGPFNTLPGDLAIGGLFPSALGLPTEYVARVTTTCPPMATEVGGQCSFLKPTVVALPWIGGTFRVEADLDFGSWFALGVTGFSTFSPGLPLYPALPSQPSNGCNLRAAPDILNFFPGAGSKIQAELPVPDDPQLVGLTFYHQLLAFEYDAVGAWIDVRSSETLQLVVGAF